MAAIGRYPTEDVLKTSQLADYTTPLPTVSRRLPVVAHLLRLCLPCLSTKLRCALYERLWTVSGLLGWRIHITVAHLPFGLILKCTTNRQGEGNALRMLDTLHVGGVNAPLLIDFVRDGDISRTLTTYVDGEWCPAVDDLPRQDRERLVDDLRDQFASLYSQTRTTSFDQPICTISCNTVIDPRISWVSEQGIQLRSNEDFFRQLWLGIDSREMPIVLCHGDLAERNLIFPGGLSAWRQGRSRVCIIDWEFAGWMPEPWDALKATFAEFEPDSEWTQMVRAIFPRAGPFLDADWIWRAEAGMGIV